MAEHRVDGPASQDFEGGVDLVPVDQWLCDWRPRTFIKLSQGD